MYDYLDFNQTNWLDALAAEYRRKGYVLQYQPFVYPCNFLPLNAQSEAQQQVVIDNDSDFILCKTMAAVFDGPDPLFNANILYTLTAGSSQRTYQSAPVPLSTVFGTGQRPHVLFKPLHFPAKSTFNITLANLFTDNLDVRLSFEGVKAYRTGSRGA